MLNQPPQYATNGYQYAVVQSGPDSDSKYAGQSTYPVPQGPVHTKWYEPFDIGVESRTGSNQVSYASPLTVGAVQRIKTDSAPDYWLITSVVNAATAQLSIWTDGDPVGPPVRLGNGGFCCIPSRGRPFLTLRASGASVVGTVIAISGYAPGEITLSGGSQP